MAFLPAARVTSRQLAGCDGALVEAARWEAGRDEDDEEADGDEDAASSDRLCSLAGRARWSIRLLQPAREVEAMQPLLACDDDARRARIARVEQQRKRRGATKEKERTEEVFRN